MARPWSEYGASDWLRLRPPLHHWKTWRYDRVNARYCALGADAAEIQAVAAHLAGRDLAIAIAFNVPAMIEWQIRFARRNLADIAYAVIDNSSDEPAAAKIRELCAANEVVYLRTPPNPYSGAGASRSHGLALNWAWRNLVMRARPPAFLFLDHDMLPLAPFDLRAALAAHACYGRIVERPPYWYLWAGFCAFDYARVASLPLDFRQDWFSGLDTGGANWSVLYRGLDRAAMLAQQAFVSVVLEPLDPEDASLGAVERIAGAWLHVGNASGWAPITPGRPARIDALLARYLGDDAVAEKPA